MNYSEKLLDPRWQKKRLKIFERDNWSCLKCGDNSTSLHVHHLKYIGEPWDVPDDFLETVCKECHKKEHFKPIPSPPFETIRTDPYLVFEHQLIDSSDGKYRALKNHYFSIIHWISSGGDIEFVNQAKDDLSNYCYITKVIFVAYNGDVYGEKQTLVRHG